VYRDRALSLYVKNLRLKEQVKNIIPLRDIRTLADVHMTEEDLQRIKEIESKNLQNMP
jgi:hypothetical protein